MKQEQICQLIKDAFELHCYGDMSEIADFLEELSIKYKLLFNKKLLLRANNYQYYLDNSYVCCSDGNLKSVWGS